MLGCSQNLITSINDGLVWTLTRLRQSVADGLFTVVGLVIRNLRIAFHNDGEDVEGW